jgi:hypothetical protein
MRQYWWDSYSNAGIVPVSKIYRQTILSEKYFVSIKTKSYPAHTFWISGCPYHACILKVWNVALKKYDIVLHHNN